MIKENILKVEESLTEICAKSCRNRAEIKLIAVTKTQPAVLIEEVINSGIIHLGENKAQELRDKSEIINKIVSWHFIGHLQANKIKYVIKSADFIHSIDSLKLAEEINSKAEQINKKQKVLLEVNTSYEASKFGLKTDEEIFKAADYCSSLSNIELAGLMTMAPYTNDEKLIRNCFSRLRKLKDAVNQKGFELTELSMGMTNDYEIAVEEGATMIRIGTAIFGERNYN